jgi:hypothetical protein
LIIDTLGVYCTVTVQYTLSGVVIAIHGHPITNKKTLITYCNSTIHIVWCCNSRANFISEKCNVPYGIWSCDVLNCKLTLYYKLSERKSPLKQLAEDGYEPTMVPTTLGNKYTHYNTMVSVKIYNFCDSTFTLICMGFFSIKM